MKNFAQEITKEIKETAKRRMNPDITSVEEMIPCMDKTKYLYRKEDVMYASYTALEKMDIYYPDESSNNLPVFIEIHGGGWYFGQKSSVEFEPFLYGLTKGYACVSLGYTLSPEGHYPLPIIEIKSAIRFLRRHAEEYRINPDRIFLWGGSAGAHLAALSADSCDTGYLQKDLNGNDANSAKPNALVLWYGCYSNEDDLDDWVFQNFIGIDDMRSASMDIWLSDPLNHITARACPTYLQHGRNDRVVSVKQSEAYYSKLMEKTGNSSLNRFEIIDNCDHADPKMFASSNIVKTFEFIENCHKHNSGHNK